MKHLLILCICSLLAASVQCKAAYKLKITRAEIVRINKEYVEARLWITKPNRYTNAVNAEIYLHEAPLDTKIKIKFYEFLSNEYRPFAIDMERSLCSFMTLEYKMILYPDLVKHGAHVSEPECPVKPGNYSVKNLVPDIGNYPPGLPFHNFKVELQSWTGTVEMAAVAVYGTLDRDAVIREQYG